MSLVSVDDKWLHFRPTGREVLVCSYDCLSSCGSLSPVPEATSNCEDDYDHDDYESNEPFLASMITLYVCFRFAEASVAAAFTLAFSVARTRGSMALIELDCWIYKA